MKTIRLKTPIRGKQIIVTYKTYEKGYEVVNLVGDWTGLFALCDKKGFLVLAFFKTLSECIEVSDAFLSKTHNNY